MAIIPTVIVPIMIIAIIGYLYNIYNDSPVGGFNPSEKIWTSVGIIDHQPVVSYPRCSMYGIFTYICPNHHPNVGKYTSTMEHLGMDSGYPMTNPSSHSSRTFSTAHEMA